MTKLIGTAPNQVPVNANLSRTAYIRPEDLPVSNAAKAELDGKVDKVEGKQLSTEDYTTSDKSKLEGIESGAQVNTVTSVAGKTGAVALDKDDVGLGNVDNVSAADLRDRSTHTGTQSASTVTGLATVATSGSYNDLDDRPNTMSQGEAEAGTATTPRLIDASVLKAAIIEHGGGGGGGDSYQTGDVLTTALTLSAPDWLPTDGSAYLRASYPDLAVMLPGERKLANPSTLPTNTAHSCAFSPDGTYLSVTHNTSPYITIYKRSGDTFTKLPNPSSLPTGNGNGCAFSPDGTYLSVAHNTSPFITIYKRSGDTFTKLPDPADLPTNIGNGCAFSPDGIHLSVAHSTSPYITIYKRSGDTFTKLPDPADLPTSRGYDCAFSPDGTYLSVALSSSPRIAIYKRSGDTFTKLPDPADLPTNTGYEAAFSPDGLYLAVAHGGSPYLTVYKRNGDTFTKLPDPADLPAGLGNGCAFSPDGTYLSVAHNNSPYITIYANVGDGGDETSFTTPIIFYPKTNTYIKT